MSTFHLLVSFEDLNVRCRYVLIALSEIFASITGLEYAFTKAPKNMRSLVMSAFLFMSAVASAIGQAFVCEFSIPPRPNTILTTPHSLAALSADPLLVWNYGTMAALAGIAGILFWIMTRKLDRQEDMLNHLSEGHVEKDP